VQPLSAASTETRDRHGAAGEQAEALCRQRPVMQKYDITREIYAISPPGADRPLLSAERSASLIQRILKTAGL